MEKYLRIILTCKSSALSGVKRQEFDNWRKNEPELTSEEEKQLSNQNFDLFLMCKVLYLAIEEMRHLRYSQDKLESIEKTIKFFRSVIKDG